MQYTKHVISTYNVNHSSILLLGSIALDTIETSHGKHEHLLGGSATYAALASSKFLKPKIVGIVGSDFSKEQSKNLRRFLRKLRRFTNKKKGPHFVGVVNTLNLGMKERPYLQILVYLKISLLTYQAPIKIQTIFS